MRFVRAFLAIDTGLPVCVVESETPLPTGGLKYGDSFLPHVDIGLAEVTEWKTPEGKPCSPAAHFFQRVEKHPHADSHPDAPKVRIRPDCEGDCPPVWFCPAGEAELLAHLDARGRDGLPAVVREHVRKIFAQRDDIALQALYNLGMSTAQLRQLPRIQRAQHRALMAAQATQVAARESDKAIAKAAKWAARATQAAQTKRAGK